MKYLSFLVLLISLTATAQKKNYFIHLTSDPMENPSSAIMSIAAATEALRQGHSVTYFAAGDGTKILIKDVIRSLHTCLLYTSPSPRDRTRSRMPSSA